MGSGALPTPAGFGSSPEEVAAGRFFVSANYRQTMIGDLVQTTAGTWSERAPMHCPMGHRLGPNRSLVGHTACAGHGGGARSVAYKHLAGAELVTIRASASAGGGDPLPSVVCISSPSTTRGL
jgi:hypothetical protein